MLIDTFLPRYDVTQVVETSVNASPDRTFALIRDTDLRDPLVDALFFLRELPQRFRRLRGDGKNPRRGDGAARCGLERRGFLGCAA